MINYSIVMRSVNANLFEINQAKGRIKMAQKMGQTPEQADRFLSRLRERLYSEGVDAALGWSTAPAAGPLSSLLTESDRNMYLDKRRRKY